jgi:hypothetical protein
VIRSTQTSVFTRATRHHVPEIDFLLEYYGLVKSDIVFFW